MCIQLYTFLQALIYITRSVYLVYPYVISSNISFNYNIFSICIRYIWFNTRYITPKLYLATLQYDHAIGPTLHYLKWSFVQGFVFESSIIIEYAFICNFIGVVYSFTIFVDVIFINPILLSLTY